MTAGGAEVLVPDEVAGVLDGLVDGVDGVGGVGGVGGVDADDVSVELGVESVGLAALGELAELVGLAVIGSVIAAGGTGVASWWDEESVSAAVEAATSTNDMADSATRLCSERFLPRVRAAAAPEGCAAPAARSMASERVASKSLATARSPFGCAGSAQTAAANGACPGSPRTRSDRAPRPCVRGTAAP